MSKLNKPKVKKLIVLFSLFFSLSIVNFGMIFSLNLQYPDSPFNTDNDNESTPFEFVPDSSQPQDFSGSGENLNIILHQSYLNNSFNTALNASDPTNKIFTLPCPKDTNFNSSYTRLEIQDIYAPNKTLTIEDESGGWITIDENHYTSFRVPASCYLTNLSIELYSPGGADIFYFDIFGAQEISGIPKFDTSKDLTGLGPRLGQHTNDSLSATWFTLTGLDQFLDVSDTFDNYFFIKVSTENGLGRWRIEDETNGDDTYSYDNTNHIIGADFTLKVGLRPVGNNVANASDINLKINNDPVSDITDGFGYWESFEVNSSASGELEYVISADWWDVTCKVSQVQINYTKTDIKAITDFRILGSGTNVLWNVTIPGGLNYFDSRLENFNTINFTVPGIWDEDSIKVSNGTAEITTIVTRPINVQNIEVQVLNAYNATFWYLNATSPNLCKSIDTYVEGQLSDKANFSDLFEFNALFHNSTQNGFLNLSVFSPDSLTLNHNEILNVSDVPSGKVIELADWVISDNVTEYGKFLTQLTWYNGTAAGYIEKNITIFADTFLDLTPPKYVFNASESLILQVNFTDSGLDQGIVGANITYQIEGGNIRNNSSGTIISFKNGIYNITIDCTDIDFNDYGSKFIEVNASKDFHNNQSEVVEILILGETELTETLSKLNFDSNETFIIPIVYRDIVKDEGIAGANVDVLVNGSSHIPLDFSDNLDGSYDITINCSDDIFDFYDYGSFNITIEVYLTNYHNQSIPFIISITGTTELIPINNPYPIKGYYNSDETFFISLLFNDVNRSEGINGGSVNVYVKETSAQEFQPYFTTITPYGIGDYNITIECNNSLFYPYGKYDIKINISKQDYHTAEYLFEGLVIGNTTLTILDPITPVSYVEGEIFYILIEYADHTRNTGISGADITYSLDGSTYQPEYDDNSDGTYNITIDTAESQFNDKYGYVDIVIGANKTYYINLTRTFTFERQITTQITPFNNPPLIEVRRGLNVTYTFNYSDTSGKPIVQYDNFERTTPFVGFQYYLKNEGDGNYTLNIDTTDVGVIVDPYIVNFSISAFGNQSQEISLTIKVTIIQTSIVIQSWNENADFARSTWTNISINFYFNDTTNNEPIDGLIEDNIVIKDNYTGTTWQPGFKLYNEPGSGNYKLNISTIGKNSGLYTLQLNISKYPDYTWNLAYIQFYLRGNNTQINLISLLDPEVILSSTGIGYNFTTFIGSDLAIEFNITDIEFYNEVVLGEADQYIITFKNLITEFTGTLQETLFFDPITINYGIYTGNIMTSELTDTGFYLINITVVMQNYENTTFSFNLTLVNSRINIISLSNQGGLLEPSGIENFYNSTIALDLDLEFNITDTEGLDRIIARDATLYLVRYLNLDTGENGTILNSLTFNSPTSTYIGSIAISGLSVGNYLINVSVLILDYNIIPLIYNLTIVNADCNIISMSNPGGQLTPSIIDDFYITFIESNIGIEFNISDVHFNTIIQIGTGISYSVYYQNIDSLDGGILFHTISESTSLHSGELDISLLPVGNYSFSIVVAKDTNNVTTVRFYLRIIEKYESRVTVVDQPLNVRAGLPFTIIFKAEYSVDSDWISIVGSGINLTLFYNNEIGDSHIYYTNGTGEIKVIIPTYSDTISLNISIQLISAYYHEDYILNISDFDIIPVSHGLSFEDLLPYLIIFGIIIGAVAISVGAYRGVVVPKKREKSRVLNEVKTIFDDAINLEHILVLYKGTGTCIFFKSYGSEEIDPELIGGFLTAVSSFGKEMVAQEALNEISYGDKMLLLADGEYIRVALVLGKKASLILRKHLKEFIEVFETTYKEILPKWRGQLNHFKNAGVLVDDLLNTSIILPHQISYNFSDIKDLKVPHSKEVLKVAHSCCEEAERKFFFIATLLKQSAEKTNKDTAEIFMGIKELRDKKMLIPIEISAIETPPISQQELNLINQKVSQISNLSDVEKQKLVNDLSQLGPAEREAYLASSTEHQKIVSAPIKSKVGEKVIEDKKTAKKEIRTLAKEAKGLKTKKNYDNSVETFRKAAVIASNWELSAEFNILQEYIRTTTIQDLQEKKKAAESEAKDFQKEKNYANAAKKYKEASKLASEIFKLGINSMMKEVKKLTNKSNELERRKE